MKDIILNFLAKYKIVLILSAIILILLFVILGGVKQRKELNVQIKVLSENARNLAHDNGSYIVKLSKSESKSKEFEYMFNRQAKVLEQLNTKLKNMSEISTVYIHTVDTVTDTVRLPQFVPIAPELEMQTWHVTEGCFDLSGEAYTDFLITEKIYTDTAFIVIVSGERQPLFNIKWLPNWGKKKPDCVRTHSNCGDIKAVIIDNRKHDKSHEK